MADHYLSEVTDAAHLDSALRARGSRRTSSFRTRRVIKAYVELGMGVGLMPQCRSFGAR